MKWHVAACCLFLVLGGCTPKPVEGTAWNFSMTGDNGQAFPHLDAHYGFDGGTADVQAQCDNPAGPNGKPRAFDLTLNFAINDAEGKPMMLTGEQQGTVQVEASLQGKIRERPAKVRAPGRISFSEISRTSMAGIKVPAWIGVHFADGTGQQFLIDSEQDTFKQFMTQCQTYVKASSEVKNAGA